MKNKSLKDLFIDMQKQMASKLLTDSNFILHPSTKGDAGELNWIQWLKTYLPKRYNVDKAYIIDSNDNISEQIDIVIYDQQYSPFVFNQDSAIYIPAESVYAVFEVKPKLNKAAVEYAGKKAESVRRLKRTSVSVPSLGGCKEIKKPYRIISGILTLTSSWNPPLGDSFEKCIKGMNDNQRLDLGCALQHGSFKVIKEDSGLRFEKSTSDEAFIFFFLKLFMELQKLGTAMPIDIEAYAKALDSI